MDKFSKQDVINYADGEMDAEVIAEFEEELNRNAELQQDLTLYRSVKSTLKGNLAPDKADEDFKATLNKLTQKHFKTKKPVAKVIAFNKIWYAAAILVIGLLVWAPWNTNLYSKYGDTEMVSFAERGNNTQTELIKATDAYNAERYQEAEDLLSPLVEKDPANDMLRFYLAVAQLKSSTKTSLSIARSNLTTVATKESLLKYDAIFFVALSYLKEKNTEDCKIWLNKIPADADVYEKAQKLLKDL